MMRRKASSLGQEGGEELALAPAPQDLDGVGEAAVPPLAHIGHFLQSARYGALASVLLISGAHALMLVKRRQWAPQAHG